MEAVIKYLEKQDPEAAQAARQRYACFEEFGEDPQSYGMIPGIDRSLSCEQEVVQQLVELQRNSAAFLRRDGKLASDELFFATPNAIVAKALRNITAPCIGAGRIRGICATNTWSKRSTGWSNTWKHKVKAPR